MGLACISFLALDIASTAFNRKQPWNDSRCAEVALSAADADELEIEIDCLVRENAAEFRAGFIAETPEKLRRIVHHFRSALGQCAPVAPQCNAPWISAVIEADGSVRPCFFHPAFGNIHSEPLVDILNAPGAVSFREHLDIQADPICRRCVCSLYRPAAALTEAAASD
jgi:MoaA/NifB/PqqE/SkfB family radical SAM enzyme